MTKNDLIFKVYNEKGELVHEDNKNYDIIQKHFADYMFLKYVLGMNYRMTKKYDYKGFWVITFIDNSNKYKMVFEGINSATLRMI